MRAQRQAKLHKSTCTLFRGLAIRAWAGREARWESQRLARSRQLEVSLEGHETWLPEARRPMRDSLQALAGNLTGRILRV